MDRSEFQAATANDPAIPSMEAARPIARSCVYISHLSFILLDFLHEFLASECLIARTINIAIMDLSTKFLDYGLIVGLYYSLWSSCLGDKLVKINCPPFS